MPHVFCGARCTAAPHNSLAIGDIFGPLNGKTQSYSREGALGQQVAASEDKDVTSASCACALARILPRLVSSPCPREEERQE